MGYKDLRSFLETLEKEGQLIRIKDEVMPGAVRQQLRGDHLPGGLRA
jgi:hypothetical protein